ncbi:MAG: hypothetical protein Q8P81_02140 [Nanoarchaeota archaeon]|nr:hypothetical protein [Nanoarchaeota archaeon]
MDWIIKRRNKKGNILTENIIFIILNIVFLSILMLFLFSKMGSAAVLEEKYAKQIALIIDSAEPAMAIDLEMEDAMDVAAKEGMNSRDIVEIKENLVTVRLRSEGGYSYSFFNDVAVDKYVSESGKGYVFFITNKNGG